MKFSYLFFFISIFCLFSIASISQDRRCPPVKPNGLSCDTPAIKKKFITKNIVSDFGADPTGKTNSHDAFECAAYFFNENEGNGKLIIPYGTYIVGKQKFAEPNEKNCSWIGYVGWLGKDLFHLTGCNNVIIEGLLSSSNKKPNICFQDNMKLGGFTKEGKPSTYIYKPDSVRYLFPADCKTSEEHNTYAANPGTFFWFEDCNKIQISNLEINGNSEKYLLGSYYGVGPSPYELWDHGVVIWNSKNITIKKVNILQIGTDGILVKNYAEKLLTDLNDQIVIDSTNIAYSGRNNISWVGGYGLTLKNSSLNDAGKGKIKMDPGSGIDIEPESHELRNSWCDYVIKDGKRVIVKDFCVNGTIENCIMKDNRVSSFTNASENGKTINCKVINSIITNKQAWSLTILNKNFIQFTNCKFNGRWVVDNKINEKLDQDPKFLNNSFNPLQ